MAYRIKGVLTKKQREGLMEFIKAYHSVVDDLSIPLVANNAVKAVGFRLMILARIALYIDDLKIIEKVLAKGGGITDGR